jgi:hypothetical protein
MISSLSFLLHRIKHATPYYQAELVKGYRSNDWKEIIRFNNHINQHYPYEIELWKSPTSRLLLLGWNHKQKMHMYSSYGVIYTNVLEGYIQPKKESLLLPFEIHYTKPNQEVEFTSLSKSASLHLIQTSFIN